MCTPIVSRKSYEAYRLRASMAWRRILLSGVRHPPLSAGFVTGYAGHGDMCMSLLFTIYYLHPSQLAVFTLYSLLFIYTPLGLKMKPGVLPPPLASTIVSTHHPPTTSAGLPLSVLYALVLPS